MSEGELKETTAQAGFTSFSMSDNTAQIFLDIHIETYATIDSLSAGYYSRSGSLGWDQKWNNITLGDKSSDSPLTIDGLIIIADFENVSSSTDRTLQRVIIGSNRLQGSISADFASFSGAYTSAVLSDGSGENVYRKQLGMVTMNFDSRTTDTGLYFVLTKDGKNAGIQVVTDKSFLTKTAWWDNP
jgi:hypothetical protein